MSFPRKTVILAFSALSALAVAVGCSPEGEEAEVGTSDLVATDQLQDLVISQVYGGGGNNGALFTHDFVELFNQSEHEVELAGKTLQYVSSGANFTKTKNILTLPEATPKLEAGHYFLIQLATGAATGATPAGQPLTDVDYVATEPAELISMSKETGKIALVASLADALDGCGGAAPALACDGPGLIDLVGYGPKATQFRGAAPAASLATTTAAVRHSGGCAHSGDNSIDFQALAPAPRSGLTPPSMLCSTVDASAPPPPPPSDAGPKPDASKPPKDAGKDAATKDSGSHAKDSGSKGTTAGDDDDDENPIDPGDGDDDDDDGTPKKPAVKRSVSSTVATDNGAAPPAFPATSPDCAMTPGPLGSYSGLGAVFGLALAGAALRRRRS